MEVFRSYHWSPDRYLRFTSFAQRIYRDENFTEEEGGTKRLSKECMKSYSFGSGRLARSISVLVEREESGGVGLLCCKGSDTTRGGCRERKEPGGFIFIHNFEWKTPLHNVDLFLGCSGFQCNTRWRGGQNCWAFSRIKSDGEMRGCECFKVNRLDSIRGAGNVAHPNYDIELFTPGPHWFQHRLYIAWILRVVGEEASCKVMKTSNVKGKC